MSGQCIFIFLETTGKLNLNMSTVSNNAQEKYHCAFLIGDRHWDSLQTETRNGCCNGADKLGGGPSDGCPRQLLPAASHSTRHPRDDEKGPSPTSSSTISQRKKTGLLVLKYSSKTRSNDENHGETRRIRASFLHHGGAFYCSELASNCP